MEKGHALIGRQIRYSCAFGHVNPAHLLHRKLACTRTSADIQSVVSVFSPISIWPRGRVANDLLQRSERYSLARRWSQSVSRLDFPISGMDISCSIPSALLRTFDVSRAVKEHSDSLTELRAGGREGGAQPTAEHVFEEEKYNKKLII